MFLHLILVKLGRIISEMKAHRGFVWYLFAIYVASVWVAYKSFQTLHSQPNKLSSASLYRSSSSPPSIRSLSLIRCVIFSDLNVKYETKDCKPLMQNLRKQLSETLTKVASNPVVSMAVASWIVPETTKKTGKSGNKFPNNENRTTFVMATIQQLIRKIVSLGL